MEVIPRRRFEGRVPIHVGSEGAAMKLRRVTVPLAIAMLLVALGFGTGRSRAAGSSVTAERRGKTVVVWAKEAAPRGRSLSIKIWHSRRAFVRGLSPARRCSFEYVGPANYACSLRTLD